MLLAASPTMTGYSILGYMLVRWIEHIVIDYDGLVHLTALNRGGAEGAQ